MSFDSKRIRDLLKDVPPKPWQPAAESGDWWLTCEDYQKEIFLEEFIELAAEMRNHIEALLDIADAVKKLGIVAAHRGSDYTEIEFKEDRSKAMTMHEDDWKELIRATAVLYGENT